jgi:glycosyltransferase involved in cell wall biosynthesis
MTKKLLIIYSGTRGGGVNDYLNLVKSSPEFHGLTLFNFGDGCYLSKLNNPSRLKYFALYFQLFFQILKVHKEYDAILIVMCSPFNVFIPLLRLFCSARCYIFYCCHNNLTFQDNLSPIRDKITKMLEIIGRLSAHKLLFLSENVYRKSNKFWSQKGSVIGFGYTELDYESDIDLHKFPDNDYWLFFGRATGYKGIECLLKALPFIDSSINIILATSGISESSKLQAESYPNVTIINRWITDPELCRLINRSRGVLLPYTDVSQSGPLYLALGHRKPIIASNINEFTILAKKIDSIRLFSSGDILSLSNVINEYHRKTDRLSIELYNRIRADFSWKIVAERLRDLL